MFSGTSFCRGRSFLVYSLCTLGQSGSFIFCYQYTAQFTYKKRKILLRILRKVLIENIIDQLGIIFFLLIIIFDKSIGERERRELTFSGDMEELN